MARHAFLRIALSLALLGALSACSSSKHQNPVGSNEEVGKVEDSFAPGEEKPKVYTAREGDSLRKIAGRPEIYGDPNLWPVLQEANADSVGQSMHVNKGTKLKIPRDLSAEQIEEAREKARQHSAASKMGASPKKPSKHAEAPVHEKPAAVAAKAPESHPTAVPASTPVPPQPVPQAKKGGVLLPVLFVLLLVLAALAVILFYFMKKDSKEENPE